MASSPDSPSDPPSFEAALSSLEAIVHDLEDGELGLAEALARYEQGVKHLRHCHELLQQAERKIELLTGITADGQARTVPFAERDESAAPAASETKRPSAPRRKAPRTLLDDEDE